MKINQEMFIGGKSYEPAFDDPAFVMMQTVIRSTRIMYKHKLLKLITYVAFASIHVWLLSEFFYFLWSREFVLDYGICFSSYLFLYTIMACNVIQKRRMNRMEEYIKKYFWNFRCCGSDFYETLSKSARFWRNISYIQVIIGFVNGLLFFPIGNDRTDLLFILMFLKKTNQTIYKYYRFVYFTTLTWISQLGIAYVNLHAYFIIQLQFQYRLLAEHLEQIGSGYKNMASQEEYQEAVRNRLIFCYKHFLILKRFRQEILELLFYPFFFIMWFGLGVSMFVAYILLVMHQTTNFIPLAFLLSAVGECAVYFSAIGQIYTDMGDDLLNTLHECKWYKWNVPNRRTYLLFLMYAQKNKILTGAGLGPMNVQFAIWMAQKTISVLAFFRVVRQKHYREEF